MADVSDSNLQEIYPLLEQFDILGAREILSSELVKDIENNEILFCLKICGFWDNHKNELIQNSSILEQGETLLLDWKEFTDLVQAESGAHEKCMISIKKGVFTFALKIFTELDSLLTNVNTQKNMQGIQRQKVLLRMATCNKCLGNYVIALDYLKKAAEFDTRDSSVIAEMADCYAFCGEEKAAKIMFREAFFHNASSVDIKFLESQMFLQVYEEVQKRHTNNEALLEWIPIEGYLLGIFNAVRQLSAVEAGKLKQDIFALENELKSEGSQPEILKPRLINKYFWLIDYYLVTNDPEYRSKINDNLLKIKLIDSDIYERYTV